MHTPESTPETAPETPQESLPRPPRRRTRAHTNVLQQIIITAMAAFMVATLFTAWTPKGLVPEGLAVWLGTTKTQEYVAPTIEYITELTPTLGEVRIGIVIGHWGSDNGAVCDDGLTELEVNQDIAYRLQKLLADQGFLVDMLEEFDERLYGYHANALISIHADSCAYINDQATGFKVASAWVTRDYEAAQQLTSCLTYHYETVTGLADHPNSVTPDMTSYHAFGEIHQDTVAAIIEVGFLNLDRQLLTGQPDTLAQGLFDGLMCFIYNQDIPE